MKYQHSYVLDKIKHLEKDLSRKIKKRDSLNTDIKKTKIEIKNWKKLDKSQLKLF